MTPKAVKYVAHGADISSCGTYRYRLWREWRGSATHENWRWFGVKDGAGQEIGEPKSLVFIMLNPSTANADADDPTIRKCVGFAKLLKYDRMEVVNLFAFRATDPRQVLRLPPSVDPVGVRNQEVVERTMDDAGKIICAWGVNGGHLGQDETMLGWLGDRKTYALGLTKDRKPRHPLYVPYSNVPVPYDGN